MRPPNRWSPAAQAARSRPRHVHVEAFCLMTYASDDRSIVERVWNSRDGVTPFIIWTRDGKTELQHVDWRSDVYAPDHRPEAGDRVFVSLTLDKARAIASERLAAMPEHIPEECREGEARREYAENLARHIYDEGRAPSIVVVIDPENWRPR